MKKLLYIGLSALLMCSFTVINPAMAQKKAVKQETARAKTKGLDGKKHMTEQNATNGLEMHEALSEDGTKMVKMPYRWFAGNAVADDKQIAIEMALSEARAEVSRSIMSIVETESEKGAMVNNGKSVQAFKSYWNQISMTVQRGCEPYGDAIIEYDSKTGMYNVRAKVAMTGPKYQKMLQDAANGFKPDQGMSQEEVQNFADINKSIIESAKGPKLGGDDE